MAQNLFCISEELFAIFGIAHRRRGESGKIFNTELICNLPKATKRIECQIIIIALNASCRGNGLSQAHKSAFIVNRQRRARRTAKADQAHRVGTDIKHTMRGIGGQWPQLIEGACKLLSGHFLHDLRLPPHSPCCKDLPRPDRLGLVMK